MSCFLSGELASKECTWGDSTKYSAGDIGITVARGYAMSPPLLPNILSPDLEWHNLDEVS
jgi:hypothetical protein